MAESTTKANVTSTGTGMETDTDPVNQKKGTYRFALNAVDESKDGNHGFRSNERSNGIVTNRPLNYEPIGRKYLEGNTTVLILVNPVDGGEEIAFLNKDDQYQTLVNTRVLGLRITNQCEIIFRLRRGNERVIYWVDGLNRARSVNLDRLHNYYNNTYQDYLRLGGQPDLFVGEKWDASSFDLIRSYASVPSFSDITILEQGNILPGSYNFAIQYVDDDLNPTEWITTSNTTNIYNDNSSNPYERIRGSKNVQNETQSFPRANKSIKLTLTNLDRNFPYYRVGIIQANSVAGTVNKVLLSDLTPTSDSYFTYTGNDGNLTEGTLADILIDHEVIYAPEHIEQQENRCLLFSTKGASYNWCEFQKYASKVSTNLTTKQVILNNISSEPNVKNAKSTFFFHGYMPGEVYAFNLNYIFPGGVISPGFHIPGKAVGTTNSILDTYELENKYLDIHNCSTNNFWGLDVNGNTLVGKPIRHHRLPFRKAVNKPLVTRQSNTINTNKYRLTMVVTLNPAFTPSPSYPVDGSSNPAVINYGIKYQVSGTGSDTIFTGTIVNTDIGKTITIYDNTTDIDAAYSGAYALLDSTSTMATTYQTGGNNRFVITFTHTPYVAGSSVNNDTSEIFGFEFSNIEKPHPDCIGFFITRAERGEDDKMILDNAILGAMTQFGQYKSFGILNPKQYYAVNNCGNTASAGKSVQYYSNGVWFFNPEFEFLHKKPEFDHIEVEGVYTETSTNMPTISNVEGSQCNVGKSKGVYIDDVQAGTSYNPEINKKKDKDDDGFDLLIGYRNTNFNYAINKTIVFPLKNRIIYLNAAAYQNFGGDTYYNVSIDNKIGMYLYDNVTDPSIFYDSVTHKNKLVYASLVRNGVNLYSNFMNRPYYKEHNNPILFGDDNVINNIKIFNGDVQISSLNLVSTTFYDMVVADRKKKSKLWKIIVGAILVVAGVIATIATAGAALPLTSLAISYGISLATAGLKFEQFKRMFDVDYEKGLKETVSDGGVYETIRESVETEDDTIRWFADMASNLYIESAVPFGLRSGLTSGIPDFVDSPAGDFDEEGFRSYLTEKLTIVDRDQGSGRLYRGFATAEYYDMNPDYMRANQEKNYIHLPLDYDCCSDKNEIFPMRIWPSEQSFQEEKTDNYRVFLPNNYKDIEGEHGKITGVYKLGSNLFVQTKEATWHVPTSRQERVTDQIVTFIGTGEFFKIPPVMILDDDKGSAGTQHKWATVKTPSGVCFVSEIEGTVWMHSDKLRDISMIGEKNWFKNNLKSNLSKQFFSLIGQDYPFDNNPANPNGIGIHAIYDSRYKRIIITKRDYLFLGDFTKVVLSIDPAKEYPIGTIFIDSRGFNQVSSTGIAAPVNIDYSDWKEVSSGVIVPKLLGDYSEDSPLDLPLGVAYTVNGEIIFKAFAGATIGATQVVPINLGSCADDSYSIQIIP